MNTNREVNRIMAKGFQAMNLSSQLQEALAGKIRYTDREMDGAALKINLSPAFKAVMKEVAQAADQSLLDYAATAVAQRMQRELAADIEAMRALDAQIAAEKVAA